MNRKIILLPAAISKLSVAPIIALLAGTASPAPAQYTLTTLANFSAGNGTNPYAGLAVVGNSLYGTTLDGGNLSLNYGKGGGTVFSVPITGGSPTTLALFNGNNGISPYGSLTVVGNTLYGTTGGGGTGGDGTVFSLPITGGMPTTLANFNGNNGSDPTGHLTVVGNTLYGTTQYGGYGYSGYGTTGYGTVFSLPISGGTPFTLGWLTKSNGAYPLAGLTIVGNTLFGTTYEGGDNNDGTVFSVPINGGTPTTLVNFNETNGANPAADLTVVGSTLYGTTAYGGINWKGTVFSLPVTGSTLTTLTNFNGSDGQYPYSSLAVVGSTLCGTTEEGGFYGLGTSYSLPITGGTPTVLANFAGGSDGADPYAGLTVVGSNLYGTTFQPYGFGTVFELSIPEPATLSLLALGSLGLLARRQRSAR
ncbi:MAG: choice-of-anchor tandem repeat GloVer-containing protein [Tepidisphaeraceae bacterium]|jgi:uncharacterized repeat protein (TIGR03803 family)